MKTFLLLLSLLLIACNPVKNINGEFVTKRDLYLSRETNYKNIPEYFISEIHGFDENPSDRVYTIGRINKGTIIHYSSTQRKGDMYIGSSTIFRGNFYYRGIQYPYKATFYDDEIDKYIYFK